MHPLRHALPLFLAGGALLAALDTTGKYLVRDHPLLLVIWARYFGQTAVVVPFALRHAGTGFWRTASPRLQLARGTLLACATACFFGALRYLPLAECAAISFLAPVIIVALSWWVLHERPTRPRIVGAIVGFAGTLVLLRPDSSLLHPAVGLLLGAAFFNAFYIMLTRKLRADNAYTSLFYSSLVGAVVLTVALPFVLVGMPSLGLADTLRFLALGAFSGAGHWCMTNAYMRAPASLLSPFSYLQLVWATVGGFLVFGQYPDGWSAVGMAIIVGSGVLVAVLERGHDPARR